MNDFFSLKFGTWFNGVTDATKFYWKYVGIYIDIALHTLL